MTLYYLCYDFIHDTLFGVGSLDNFTFTLMGQSLDMSSYLSHTLSIVFIGLLFVFIVKFIIWLFKWFGGLFKW